jgi:hypothetical protein
MRRAVRVTLYLDPGSDPVTGTVAIDDEQQRRFQGWIELAHVIDRAHTSGPAEHEESRASPG